MFHRRLESRATCHYQNSEFDRQLLNDNNGPALVLFRYLSKIYRDLGRCYACVNGPMIVSIGLELIGTDCVICVWRLTDTNAV
jgi:hypothetical protein